MHAGSSIWIEVHRRSVSRRNDIIMTIGGATASDAGEQLVADRAAPDYHKSRVTNSSTRILEVIGLKMSGNF